MCSCSAWAKSWATSGPSSSVSLLTAAQTSLWESWRHPRLSATAFSAWTAELHSLSPACLGSVSRSLAPSSQNHREASRYSAALGVHLPLQQPHQVRGHVLVPRLLPQKLDDVDGKLHVKK